MLGILVLVLVLLWYLLYAALRALLRAGLPVSVLYIVVSFVALGTLMLVVLYMGMMFGWDSVFSFFRPEKEFRKWVKTRARDSWMETKRLRSVRVIPAPGSNEALRDPEFERLVYAGNLDAAEEYLREALERARGGDPEKLSVYTHYMEYLLRLRRGIA